MLVLERADAARARGARVLGTIRGYGASSDAHHLTAPREDGHGQAGAMRAALADAGVARRADRLRQRPRHLDAAQRPRRDARDQARARRARRADPGLLDQVRDRAPARRRRRRRGRRHAARAARPHRPAHARPVRARRRARPRLRARRRAPARARRRQPQHGVGDGNGAGSGSGAAGERPVLALSNSFGFGGHNAVLCLEAP